MYSYLHVVLDELTIKVCKFKENLHIGITRRHGSFSDSLNVIRFHLDHIRGDDDSDQPSVLGVGLSCRLLKV